MPTNIRRFIMILLFALSALNTALYVFYSHKTISLVSAAFSGAVGVMYLVQLMRDK